MKTYLPKDNVAKKWYAIDAQWKTLWKIATTVANILRWKSKPTFTPHMDTWDYVVITNCDKFVVTWNKMQDKKYYRHSRYAKDGLKEITAEKMMDKNPKFILQNAVAWMIPNNKLKKWMLMRLKLFVWDVHDHEAQKPVEISI